MRSIIIIITGYLSPVVHYSEYQEFVASVDTRNKVWCHSRGYSNGFGILYNNDVFYTQSPLWRVCRTHPLRQMINFMYSVDVNTMGSQSVHHILW